MYALRIMKIQDASEMTGFSKRTIHYYIKEGLICPSTDSKSGYYNFSEEDCRRLLLIRQYRNAGLPLSAIRSMLERPVTAGYYLNHYAEQLREGARWLQSTLDSISYILDQLPLNPDFSCLYEITQESGIPEKFPLESADSDNTYNAALVNRCLWSSFLENEPMDEYRQFLWAKLNRLTAVGNKDYQLLNDYLKMLPPQQLDQLFFFHSQQYSLVASLKKEEIPSYADSILDSIHGLLWKKSLISYWKKYYRIFFAPVTRIFASDLSRIVAEMSPFFMNYRENIHLVCALAYQKLHSEEGLALLEEIRHVLGDEFEIENNYHGELVSLATLPELYQKIGT